MELRDYLRSKAEEGFIPWKAQVEATRLYGLSLAQVENEIYELGFIPERYKKNGPAISKDEQKKLFSSTVAVFGCGGLGGYVIEELTRLGIGNLVIVDPDVFVEDNLNRQLFSSPDVIGKMKVEIAKERIERINPVVNVTSVSHSFSTSSSFKYLDGVDVCVDCLDSVPVRLELASICNKLKIPLVHGAIGGWQGQVLTQFPGENSLEKIYKDTEAGLKIGTALGNPAFTPALVASSQVAEVVKILTDKKDRCLSKRMLFVDLKNMKFEIIKL